MSFNHSNAFRFNVHEISKTTSFIHMVSRSVLLYYKIDLKQKLGTKMFHIETFNCGRNVLKFSDFQSEMYRDSISILVHVKTKRSSKYATIIVKTPIIISTSFKTHHKIVLVTHI